MQLNTPPAVCCLSCLDVFVFRSALLYFAACAAVHHAATENNKITNRLPVTSSETTWLAGRPVFLFFLGRVFMNNMASFPRVTK